MIDRIRLIVLLIGCGCSPGDSLQLPEVLAASKWIEYATWADSSSVCMDDRLDAWDGFVEGVAGILGLTAPEEKILYSWVPKSEQGPDRWPCGAMDDGCQGSSDGRPLVFVSELEMLHELVHAVEVPVLGEAHPVFLEGMAEYLSRSESTEGLLGNFVERFSAAVDDGHVDYPVFMHFVGSVIENHGVERYKDFRSRVPAKGKLSDFSAAYYDVFGEEFMSALDGMSFRAIVGRWQPWGCDAAKPSLPWPTEGTLDVTIGGKCGDGEFYGGGFADGEAGFSKNFGLDVSVRGIYESKQVGGTGATPYSLLLTPCPETGGAAVVASDAEPLAGLLNAGRYNLQIWFPPSTQASAEVTLAVSLAFAAP